MLLFSHSVVRGGNSDTFVTLWTVVACQAPLSMEFSRQEYWSGLPNGNYVQQMLHQGLFPTQRSNPTLLGLLYRQADSLPLSYLGSPVKKDSLDIGFEYLNILLRILLFPREKDYIIIFQHCRVVERAQTLKSYESNFSSTTY